MDTINLSQGRPVASLAAEFPKLNLAHTPTPLHPLDRLSETLGGPRIWIKREDATGLAFGGNKVRKLEYLLGSALAKGRRTLVTVGAFQSNHVRQTAAAAAVAGLACEAVLVDTVDIDAWNYQESGNVMLDDLLGANIHRVARSASPQWYIGKLLASLTLQGKKPVFIPVGGSSALGSLGHVELAGELLSQKQEIDAIYLASSSGGTQAGLLAGMALSGNPVPVKGVSVYEPDAAKYAVAVRKLASKAVRLLGANVEIREAQVEMDGDYRGAGYGIPTEACQEAIRLLASTEAIVLDPVYTGKGMAALIADIRSGKYSPDQDIVFLHTGGGPSLFAYAETFRAR